MLPANPNPKLPPLVLRIKHAFPESLGRLEFMDVDFSILSTIKPGVEAFLAREQRLDVLVNNGCVRHVAFRRCRTCVSSR